MAAPSRRAIRDRRRRARRFAFLAAVALVFALYIGPVRSYISARERAATTRAAVQRLEREHAALESQLRALSTQAATIALARENGWIFPGETPFRVVPSRHG